MSASFQSLHAPSLGKTSPVNPARILLVDDDLQLRRALRTILASSGYVVLEAMTGEEALGKVQQEGSIGLILLDLKMPGIGGIETCRRLRKIVGTPILVISVRREQQDKVQASDAGADDYLVKPFGIQDLLSRMHVLLGQTTSLNPFPGFQA
jgi:two-component system KDP operon response regulator KdpE